MRAHTGAEMVWENGAESYQAILRTKQLTGV